MMNRRHLCQSSKAFTLIELLVVVAIIAVLMAILLPSMNLARDAARRAACLSNLRQAGIAARMYAQENNEVQASWGSGDINDSPAATFTMAREFWPVTLAPYFGVTNYAYGATNYPKNVIKSLVCPAAPVIDGTTSSVNMKTYPYTYSITSFTSAPPYGGGSAASPRNYIYLKTGMVPNASTFVMFGESMVFKGSAEQNSTGYPWSIPGMYPSAAGTKTVAFRHGKGGSEYRYILSNVYPEGVSNVVLFDGHAETWSYKTYFYNHLGADNYTGLNLGAYTMQAVPKLP